jgi:hypothetical protein
VYILFAPAPLSGRACSALLLVNFVEEKPDKIKRKAVFLLV